MKPATRMPGLDGLRALAILLVISQHVVGSWRELLVSDWQNQIANKLGHGVQLFFVVSAFTLTLRASRDARDLSSYAVRRLARVGPGYWLAGLAYTGGALCGLTPFGNAVEVDPLGLLIAAVFGSAWDSLPRSNVVPGGWSVCCEVAFYLALPVVVRLVNGRISRAVGLTLVTLAIAQLRARHAIAEGSFSFEFLTNPIEQAPAFLCGVTAALVYERFRLPNLRLLPMILIVFAVLVLPVFSAPDWYLLRHLQFAMTAAVIVTFTSVRPPALLTSRLALSMGEVSYSMYLVHFAFLRPSFWLAHWLLPADTWATASLHLLLCTGAAYGMSRITYAYIEKPAIDWAHSRTTRRRVPA